MTSAYIQSLFYFTCTSYFLAYKYIDHIVYNVCIAKVLCFHTKFQLFVLQLTQFVIKIMVKYLQVLKHKKMIIL